MTVTHSKRSDPGSSSKPALQRAEPYAEIVWGALSVLPGGLASRRVWNALGCITNYLPHCSRSESWFMHHGGHVARGGVLWNRVVFNNSMIQLKPGRCWHRFQFTALDWRWVHPLHLVVLAAIGNIVWRTFLVEISRHSSGAEHTILRQVLPATKKEVLRWHGLRYPRGPLPAIWYNSSLVWRMIW